jgi:hypothetical protein
MLCITLLTNQTNHIRKRFRRRFLCRNTPPTVCLPVARNQWGRDGINANSRMQESLRYRQLQIDMVLGRLNGNAEQLVKWIDIGMAVTWIKISWSTQVKAATISNCFSQVGLGVQVNLDPVDEVGDEEVGRSR